MNLRNKLKATLLLAVVCLVLVFAASYAWFALSTAPEVSGIETKVGANGGLEIALLTEQTYADPVEIRSKIGSSAAEQDALESNKSWGNVIELNDERYGLGNITLLPARLNLTERNGTYTVSQNMLKTADFGIDGRISILSEKTVSTIMGETDFTYFVDRQLYGVRAIGTISNLSVQQTSLAAARTLVKSHTAAAARTVKHTWRDHGSEIMDIFNRRYLGQATSFTAGDVQAIRNLAEGMLESLYYVDSALRQGIIGIGAAQIHGEANFDALCVLASDRAVTLTDVLTQGNVTVPEEFATWAKQLDDMEWILNQVVAESGLLSNGGTWKEIEPLMDALLDAEKAYLDDFKLSSKEALAGVDADNVIVVGPESGIMAELAAFTGNYSAFAMWTGKGSVEVRTADRNATSYLLQLERILGDCKAAVGGWTRANLDDTYGYAVDLAFRCNEPSQLLLQTAAALRVQEHSEFPVTQGSGSYMRFTSENMDTEQLLELMDTIRIGFVSDRNTLLAVAKLNVSSYEEQEEGIFAPLYLYDYTLREDGVLSMGQRLDEDASILTLPQNSPAVVTVVVWLDGDHVDNGMVGVTGQHSMNGVLNLQFASSADLMPSGISMEEKKE